jgi:hypothetical protein
MEGSETLANSWTSLKPLVDNILVERHRFELFEWGYYQVYRAVFFGQGAQLYKLLEAEITKHLISQVYTRRTITHFSQTIPSIPTLMSVAEKVA